MLEPQILSRPFSGGFLVKTLESCSGLAAQSPSPVGVHGLHIRRLGGTGGLLLLPFLRAMARGEACPAGAGRSSCKTRLAAGT